MPANELNVALPILPQDNVELRSEVDITEIRRAKFWTMHASKKALYCIAGSKVMSLLKNGVLLQITKS